MTITNKRKIESFTDLDVWKHAHELVILIYKVTKTYPKEEMYSLVDQMKRCGVSITSNIAEGFSRQGKREKIQFYFTAKGSLTELQNQLLLSRDVGFLPSSDFKELAYKSIIVHKLLNDLLKAQRINSIWYFVSGI